MLSFSFCVYFLVVVACLVVSAIDSLQWFVSNMYLLSAILTGQRTPVFNCNTQRINNKIVHWVSIDGLLGIRTAPGYSYLNELANDISQLVGKV